MSRSSIRGDASDDFTLDLSDAVVTLGFLFLGAPQPACLDAADTTDDGQIDVSDPIATLSFLFLSGSRPPRLSRSPTPTRRRTPSTAPAGSEPDRRLLADFGPPGDARESSRRPGDLRGKERRRKNRMTP